MAGSDAYLKAHCVECGEICVTAQNLFSFFWLCSNFLSLTGEGGPRKLLDRQLKYSKVPAC